MLGILYTVSLYSGTRFEVCLVSRKCDVFYKSPNLKKKYSKNLFWAWNLNFPPITVNNKFKFQAQDSFLEYFMLISFLVQMQQCTEPEMFFFVHQNRKKENTLKIEYFSNICLANLSKKAHFRQKKDFRAGFFLLLFPQNKRKVY